VPEVCRTEEYTEPEIEYIEPEVEQEVELEEECVEPITETPLQIHYKTLLVTILRLHEEKNLNSKTVDTINEIYINPDKSFAKLQTIVLILRDLQASRKFLDTEYDTLQYASDFLNRKHD